ncbi:MAG: HDOD domain-containing protein [Desulfobacterales bacterium]|nr:HDOD domain-containing protein [Desulfobacterales bacterium]
MNKMISVDDLVRQVIIKNKKDVPVFNKIAMKIQQEFSTSNDPDIDRIIGYIMQDQSLAADVIALANSSFYKGISQVTTIKEAATRLGMTELSNCVMQATQSVNYNSKDRFSQQYMAAMWQHSVACATGSQWIVQRCGYPEFSAQAFLSGLMHDIGKLLVLKAFEIIKQAKNQKIDISVAAKNEFLNVLHSEYGYELMCRWNLPDEYCIVCRDHHEDEFDESNILLVATRLADLACRKLGIGISKDPEVVLVTSVEANILNLSEIALAELEIALESRTGLK